MVGRRFFMAGKIVFNMFEQGRVITLSEAKEAKGIQWNEHATFKGVYLKHILCGADTDNKFSCHLVRIDPGCEIGEHIHAGKWETHEVISGEGQCTIDNKRVDYMPGVLTAIPDSVKHKVIANEKGLLLFAKFVPALL
jgi:mannose-6-phosphate isomerase-like protein (cupin superfamily)